MTYLNYMKARRTVVVEKDWTDLFERYKGEWVALANDEQTVVAHASSAQAASEQAHQRGCEAPIMLRVPKRELVYVGTT